MRKVSVLISSAVLAASLNAQVEVTGKITHESALYKESGRTVGAAYSHKDNDAFKSETSARIYLDGNLGDSADTFHVELQGYNNSAGNQSENSKSFTQREVLREAYIDTNANDWAIRAGKQQVVWGKADGYKALDLINPTDFSEMAQNQGEDSRIPTFMLNAEKYNEDGSSLQVVLSQPRENIFAGLNRSIDTNARTNGAVTGNYTDTGWNSPTMFASYAANTASKGHDEGSPFVLKGVDSITGRENGFLNIVPDIGTVAALFGRAFQTQGTADEKGLAATAHATVAGGPAHAGFTVGYFNSARKLSVFSSQFGANSNVAGENDFGDINFGYTAFWRDTDGSYDAAAGTGMEEAANSGDGGTFFTGQQTLGAFGAKFNTNLHNTTAPIDSTFEYMDRTNFVTFDTFVNATSEYVYDMPSDTDANLALRYNNTTPEGLNYSLAYSYNYDPNPVIKLSWRDSSGNELQTTRNNAGYTFDSDSDNSADSVKSAWLSISGIGGKAESYAKLRFTETLERAHNLGAAVDYAIDTEKLGPVVIRAEGLYQKDVYSPIIDRGAMSIGDLTKALQMKKGDRFKYVIGADITAFTDMMVSAQFIQDRNLDYVDKNVDYDGSTSCNTTDTGYNINSAYLENCGVYTADFASMHMTNGFKKAEKNKEFYSLYLSKPFGASKEHRWNNIFMYEENGGKWNRLDAEYSINDNTQLTAEYNKYWGNKDTQFGQLADSSNVQVGVKVSF